MKVRSSNYDKKLRRSFYVKWKNDIRPFEKNGYYIFPVVWPKKLTWRNIHIMETKAKKIRSQGKPPNIREKINAYRHRTQNIRVSR